MVDLADDCIFLPLTQEILEECGGVDCEHQDLNDFFNNDALLFSDQLLGKSYCFILNDRSAIVCVFTVSNDSINSKMLPRGRRERLTRDIPHPKRHLKCPAVLIGRLGVNKDFKRMGVGCQLMNYIKGWFVDNHNKTGCRFVVVDAYNEEIPINYYKKNGFDFLFSTEDQERECMEIEGDLKTRIMVYDLIALFSDD